jgi:hypothetical protein
MRILVFSFSGIKGDGLLLPMGGSKAHARMAWHGYQHKQLVRGQRREGEGVQWASMVGVSVFVCVESMVFFPCFA